MRYYLQVKFLGQWATVAECDDAAELLTELRYRRARSSWPHRGKVVRR